ncbi:MAG: hypothetical protein IJ038_01410 [Clostridia bacterium]|nr:hypothetical protein [Clostridia bacterium]
MFGYVKTYTPELKVSEYEYYRAAYCGLCRSMGKCTGQCSRMTLSYDFAFLALLRISLAKEKTALSRRRCMAHPLRKKAMMERNGQLDYCAYAAALLTYHKLSDDISDEKGKKKAAAVLARPLAKKMRRRAIKKGGLSALDETIAARLSELSAFERSGDASVDIPADAFGKLLASITEYGLEGSEAKIARNIGYHVGKWIYITDALDDFSEDAERGRYNPFISIYGGEMSERDKAVVSDALKNELCDAECAFDLIEFGDDPILKNIIYNVFYLGMPRTVESVVSGRFEGENKGKCNRKDSLNTDERSV